MSEHLPLTPVEIECVKLVAEGWTAAEIAKKATLARSVRAVERHVERARLKLGANNRAHLVAKAFLLGIIPLEPTIFDYMGIKVAS